MQRNSSNYVLHQHGFVNSDEVGLSSETLSLDRPPKNLRYRRRLKNTSAIAKGHDLFVTTHTPLPGDIERVDQRSQATKPAATHTPLLLAAEIGEPQCIRLAQLLELLPVSASSVWRWVRSGRIRAYKLGPRITVFSRKEVMDVFFSEAAR